MRGPSEDSFLFFGDGRKVFGFVLGGRARRRRFESFLGLILLCMWV